mmetsp:Transcript_55064/g.128847  ORF Transcript_55064/g.128847 Transcript_55064/m.128847 type:complete len:446 (+) Transcript_55064:88-1425(+)
MFLMRAWLLCVWLAWPLILSVVECEPQLPAPLKHTDAHSLRRLATTVATTTTVTATVSFPTVPGTGQQLLRSPNATGFKFLAWAADVGESIELHRKIAVLTSPNGSTVNIRAPVPCRVIRRRAVVSGQTLGALLPLVLVANGSNHSVTYQTTSSSSRSTSSSPSSSSSSRTPFTSTTTDTFTLTNVAVVGEPVVRFTVSFTTSDADGFMGDANVQHALRSSIAQLLEVGEPAVAVDNTRTLETRRLDDTVAVGFAVTPPEGTSSEEIVTRVSKLDDTQKFADTLSSELSKAGADGYDTQVVSISSPVVDYGTPTTTETTTTTTMQQQGGVSPMLLLLLVVLVLILCCCCAAVLCDQHPGVDQSTPLLASTFTTDIALKGDVMIPVAFPDPFLPGLATVVSRSRAGVAVEHDIRIKAKLDTALALEEPLEDDVAKNSEVRQRKGQE